jgi:phage shock protein PspC (stress-responsive transcriptional regulator)
MLPLSFFVMAAMFQRSLLRGPSPGLVAIYALGATVVCGVAAGLGTSLGTPIPDVLLAWLLLAVLALDGRRLARAPRG